MFTSKKVKIVATIGPATSSYASILKLGRIGVDVFRLNMAHQSSSETISHIKNIRRAEKELKKTLTVMGDLAGPKIRIEIPNELKLIAGDRVELVTKINAQGSKEIGLNIPSIIKSLKAGAEVYLGDGAVKLTVKKKIGDRVVAKVEVGGTLRPRMGFAAEGMKLKFTLSKKDRVDIRTLTENGADAIAVSFIQRKKDIEDVRKIVKNKLFIVPKIETADAVENIEEIFDAADALMIARGDLGLTTPLAELPMVQKKIIRMGLKKAKPVITATQMLESMINNPLPTRAEVTDVANAILDGTDAVMLSGETAVGKHPFDTVSIMRKIIINTALSIREKTFNTDEFVTDAVGQSVVDVAGQIGAKLIVVFTESGGTARRIARHRSVLPIIALTPNKKTLRRLNFIWGVHPEMARITTSFNEMIEIARHAASNNPVKKLKKGDKFVISAGVPFGQSGSTNLILVQSV